MIRPNPVRWLWYSYGGTLPQRYRDWVRHDVTARTWVLRHFVRTLLIEVPILIVLFVVFGLVIDIPGPVLWPALALGLIVGTYYSLSYVKESGDARLVKYGYPSGHASEVRGRPKQGDADRERADYESRWR
jgi:hypothetical protein